MRNCAPIIPERKFTAANHNKKIRPVKYICTITGRYIFKLFAARRHHNYELRITNYALKLISKQFTEFNKVKYVNSAVAVYVGMLAFLCGKRLTAKQVLAE